MDIKSFDFYGLKISDLSNYCFEDYLINTIKHQQKAIIYGYSLGSIVYAKKVPEILWGNNADISLIDGQLLLYLLRLLRFKVNYELSIPQAVNLILKIANQNSLSVLLFGSDNETNFKACQNIKKNFPEIKVLPGLNGFNKDLNFNLKYVEREAPNILLIGISSPTKEILAFREQEKLKANIIIPCGGMIDVLAGKTAQSSNIIKRMGMASFVRLLQEPRRLYKRYAYIYFNIFFIFLPKFFFNLIIKRNNFSIPGILKIENITY